MTRFASSLALLFLASGCHEPFSNEDILFLKAPPRDIHFDVPGEQDNTGRGLTPQQAMPAAFAIYYEGMVATATSANAGIFALLDKIDTITSSGAIVRDDNRRAWGPIRLEPNNDFEVLLVVDRVLTATIVQYTSASVPLETDSLFRYAFNVRKLGTEEYVQVLYGEAALRSWDDRDATGYFCVDLDAGRSINSKQKETGSYCATYDLVGERQTIELAVRAAGSIYVNPDAAFTFHREVDGSGRFFFSRRGNVFPQDDPSRPEITSITVRWDETLAARADASICGGDTEYELWATECWDHEFIETFFLSNIPGYPIAGSLTGCPLPFRDPDAIAQPCEF